MTIKQTSVPAAGLSKRRAWFWGLFLAALAFSRLGAAEFEKDWFVGVYGGGSFPAGQRYAREKTREGAAAGAMLHYRFTDRWGAGLSYDYFELPGNGDFIKSSQKYEGQLATLSASFLFWNDENWSPYVEGGLGAGSPQRAQKMDNLAARAGAGLQYDFSDLFFLRFFVNYFVVTRTGASDVELHVLSPGLMLAWAFDVNLFSGPAKKKVSAGDVADFDQDGVPDRLDLCPNTRKGTIVNNQGCPLDNDEDGVPDGWDTCPGTPTGTAVDETGCPPKAVEKDTDKDGVLDGADECPDTPEGTAVDAKGCPEDADGDGVPDARDRCPGTPPGAEVNSEGCQALKPSEKISIELNVLFDSGRDAIKPEYRGEIKKVADFMLSYPETRAEIEGHTDNVGSVASNVSLSQKRAESVRRYLVQQFEIEPGRITAKGYGPHLPVASNNTPQGREANRRVVAVLSAVKN